ncbi:unnamed protein product [Pedinophyceae sp. YPF-701]|nr:unnamed protein product [Pedinophyceae sp. YPF-701]
MRITRAASRATAKRRAIAARAAANSDEPVIIVGGGINGCSIAYQLSLKGRKAIVIERSSIAASSSGKAGGFLARGWGDGGVTQALHRVSFDLHAQLAETLGIESYRKIPVLSVQPEGGGLFRMGVGSGVQPAWLSGDGVSARMLDADGGAQVVPRELTEKMFAASGAELVTGAAEGLEMSDDGTCEGVSVRHEDGSVSIVRGAQVVVAMGIWSVLLEDWLGSDWISVPMEGIKSTSLVFDGGDAVRQEPYALFTAEDSNGCHLEVYPRPDGTVYICGIGGSDYVRGSRLRAGGDCEKPEYVHEDPSRVAAGTASFTAMAPGMAGKEPLAQACMRPCASDALPMIGGVPGTTNLFLATASNCWGILWGPVVGLAMAELLTEGESKCVDLTAFSPGRFMRRKTGRGRKMGSVPTGEQW